MNGMDGGASAYKQLMMLLSKRVRIVMTNESILKNSKEYYHQHKASHYSSLDGFYRRQIHELSHCNECNTLWSCDYVASLNISRSFISYFQTGAAAFYLRPIRRP